MHAEIDLLTTDDGPISAEAVSEAIVRLGQTNEGRAALRTVERLLHHEGRLLDGEQWAALETLCRVCAAGGAPSLRHIFFHR